MRSLWVAMGLMSAFLMAAVLWRGMDSVGPTVDQPNPPAISKLTPVQLSEIEELRRQFGSPIPMLESAGGNEPSFAQELQTVAGINEAEPTVD